MIPAQQELEDLLVAMSEEEHEALQSLHLGKLPVDVAIFASLVKALPSETRKKYQVQIRQLARLNSLMLLSSNSKPPKTESTTSTRTEEEEQVKIDNISFEDWQKRLVWHYNNLKIITEAHFSPSVWQALDFTLSIANILHIKDCSLPFMGILLGRPSSYKTLAIELLRGTPNTIYSDAFTAKSFVSHNSGVSEKKLAEIDLLPKIKNKVFLTPELSPTFSSREEDLTNILGIVTRLMDGHGFESDSGACGHRGYSGEFMFTWIGACVEIPRKVHRLLSTLGPKIYFLRLEAPDKKEDDYLQQLQNENFKQRREEVYRALVEYLKWFAYCPHLEQQQQGAAVGGSREKIAWGQDDPEALRLVVRFAKLLAHLRGSVPIWESRDTQGVDYAYSLPSIEEPSRAATQLRNLARGHALSEGRTSITKQDLAIVARTMLSTAPIERVAIFDLLLAMNGSLTTSDIVHGLGTSNPTAKRGMAELRALGLVDMPHPDACNAEWGITLKRAFHWFLSEEFKWIREGKQQQQQFLASFDARGEESDDDAEGGGQNSFSSDLAERKTPPTQASSIIESDTSNQQSPIQSDNESSQLARCHICNHQLPLKELQGHLAQIHSIFAGE
jgi:hypothetical protein